MSAFVHDLDHIDLLVSVAVKVDAAVTVPDATARFGFRKVALTTSPDTNPHRITPTDLGRLLLAENVTSVRHLYDTVDDTPEGVEYDLAVSTYRYRPVDLVGELGDAWPAAALKALASYAYQCCEHDQWDHSTAKTWVDAITKHLHRLLPGYDHPNAWMFNRTIPAPATRRP